MVSCIFLHEATGGGKWKLIKEGDDFPLYSSVSDTGASGCEAGAGAGAD